MAFPQGKAVIPMSGPVMTGKYPYGAWLIRAAICDLVDEEGGEIEAAGRDDLRFLLTVFGNRSAFEVSLVDLPGSGDDTADACEVSLTMCRPAASLGEAGSRRAMHYILDSVVQRIENELRLHAGS